MGLRLFAILRPWVCGWVQAAHKGAIVGLGLFTGPGLKKATVGLFGPGSVRRVGRHELPTKSVGQSYPRGKGRATHKVCGSEEGEVCG